MKYDAEGFGLETVGGRVQAATTCSRPEADKLLVESRGAVFPVGLWCDAEHDDGAAADQENYAAAMRRIKSSCSDWDSAPMVKASRRLSERAKIEREGEAKGFVLAMAKVALAKDFHADDAFSGGAHLEKHCQDRVGIGVHVRANGIDADEIDIDPGRFGGGAERFDAVARAAMSANDALFFGFGENVHDAFVALGPIAFGEAVHEADVDVIGAELAAKTVEIGASGGGVARPRFGEHGDCIARDVLQGFGNVRVTAVRIGGIEEAQTMIIAIEEQVGEAFNAEGSLVGMMTAADGSGAHGEAAGLDVSLTEGHSVGGAELARERGKSERTLREGGRMDPDGTRSTGGAMDEIATFHAASLLQRFRGSSS